MTARCARRSAQPFMPVHIYRADGDESDRTPPPLRGACVYLSQPTRDKSSKL